MEWVLPIWGWVQGALVPALFLACFVLAFRIAVLKLHYKGCGVTRKQATRMLNWMWFIPVIALVLGILHWTPKAAIVSPSDRGSLYDTGTTTTVVTPQKPTHNGAELLTKQREKARANPNNSLN